MEIFVTTFEIDKHSPTPILTVETRKENNITMYTGEQEILKITDNGFFVRGKRVPVDDNEALAVYKAFKQFLVYHALATP